MPPSEYPRLRERGSATFHSDTGGEVNLSNPAASFLTDSVLTTGVFRSDQSEFDENHVIVDIDLARDLLQYDTEASAIEISIDPKANLTGLTEDFPAYRRRIHCQRQNAATGDEFPHDNN